MTIGVEGHGNENCNISMFTGPDSKSALVACEAQYAFQRNWFPDPIAGTVHHFKILILIFSSA